MNALDRTRQHIQEGEQLVTALKDLIAEQRAEGTPKGPSECPLRNVLPGPVANSLPLVWQRS